MKMKIMISAASTGKVIFIALIVYVFLLVFFYFFQEWVLFHPQPLAEDIPANGAHLYGQQIEEISIEAEEDVVLKGWLVKAVGEGEHPLVIYFGGNAEEVSHMIEKADRFGDYALALMNYRGYGLSEGEPSQKNLQQDALLIYDSLTQREDIDSERIVLMGRSLGTGVAAYLASQRDTSGVILVTPFDSIEKVGRQMFPFIPVSLILRHNFDAVGRAPDIDAPMLAFGASEDQVVPPEHAENLVEQWGGEKEYVLIEGENHNSIIESRKLWQKLEEFLAY